MNNVLFEIGLEELPSRFIFDTKKQLKDKTASFLNDLRITFDDIYVYATPRRLAVLVNGIANEQSAYEEIVRGPKIQIAKDQDGNWTKAAIGFTKGQQVSVDDIFIQEEKGHEYIFVKKVLDKKQTVDLLPQYQTVIEHLHFPQTMRWGSLSNRFARPIRWLVAMYNDAVIPFTIANVQTDRKTFGHRFLSGELTLAHAKDYMQTLKDAYVIVDDEKRESLIVEQIKAIEAEKNVTALVGKNLLEEVNYLVEYPTAFIGTFDSSHLQLPKEVLITSMEEHQRYFPVEDDKGNLLAYFIGVRNGDEAHLDNVIRGNEKVLKARLADAEFFYDEDKKQSIDTFNEKLKQIVFQEDVGTVFEKMQHTKAIALYLCEQLNLDDTVKEAVHRASSIYKFDLVTNMVNEFPELQGIMGEYYALHFGESAAVATAIREQYLPTHANGDLPQTDVGNILSVADKLDTIIACISVGLIPSGSQDPYALRRQAIGLLRIIHQNNWDISVQSLVDFACKQYDISAEDVRETIQSFMKDRGLYILEQANIHKDIGTAIVQKRLEIFHKVVEKGKLLSEKKHDESFKESVEAFIRVLNIGKKYQHHEIMTSLFQTESEKRLYAAYEKVANVLNKNSQANEAQVLHELETLAEPIHDFFEHNMVMDDNEDIKTNRIALLQRISELIRSFADFTQIEWKK